MQLTAEITVENKLHKNNFHYLEIMLWLNYRDRSKLCYSYGSSELNQGRVSLHPFYVSK